MSKSIQNSSIWNSKPTKLAILVPTRDTVHSQFAYCLAQLIKTTSEAGIDTYLFFDSSTILLNQREKLIENAKDIKGDTQDWYGEDFMLLTKLRLNEFNVYIDTILSMDIKHLGIYAFGNND